VVYERKESPYAFTKGKTMRIAITGALGSLGRRLVFDLMKNYDVERLVCYGRNEFQIGLHQIQFKQLLPIEKFECIHWFCGDVRDQTRMTKAFHGCEVVVHAAALKRVDSSLDNPTELKQTNIDGVERSLEAAMEAGVKKFVFISSDKAVHPENIYGCSKMFGEQLVRSFNAYSYPRGMACLSVRYGNVLGSRGSVYWPWRQALLQRKPVRLTDPKMTRYFLSFQEAINTIYSAIHYGEAGQTIIPYCECYRITDFLKAMCLVFWPSAKTDEAYEVMGLRKGGEKIHESLVTQSESQLGSVRKMFNQQIYFVLPGHLEEEVYSPPSRTSFLLESDVAQYPENEKHWQAIATAIIGITKDPLAWFDSVGETL
jgi:UDP-N-acetylglucosamine 4,6-dehydratase